MKPLFIKYFVTYVRVQDVELLVCPNCGSNSFEIDAEYLGSRILNGTLQCENNHVWNIVHEVLRFDLENDDSQPKYLDTPSTGFPSVVEEQERLEFLEGFRNDVKTLSFSDHPHVITGDLVLFLESITDSSGTLFIVHQDEQLLRQAQEIVVSKLLYDNVSLVKTSHIALKTPYTGISIFEKEIELKDHFPSATSIISYKLDKFPSENVIWEGDQVTLSKKVL